MAKFKRKHGNRKAHNKKNYRGKRKFKKSMIIATLHRQPIPVHAYVRFQWNSRLVIAAASAGSVLSISTFAWGYQPITNGTLGANCAVLTGYATTDNFNCFTNYLGNLSLYRTYRPLECDILVRCNGEEGAFTRNYDVCVLPTTSNAGLFAVYRTMSQSQFSKCARTGANPITPKCIKHKMSVAKLNGVRRQQVMDDSIYSAAYNNVPASVSYWQVGIQSETTVQSVNPVTFDVELSMLCKLEDPNITGSSD